MIPILKNTILCSLLILTLHTVVAQEAPPAPDKEAEHDELQSEDMEKVKSKMRVLRIGFLTSELHLTEEDAKAFWPIYNVYSDEISKLHTDHKDILKKEEEMLNIRKKYNPDFIKILGEERTNKLFVAEHEFMRVVYEKAISKKRGMHRGHSHRDDDKDDKGKKGRR